MTAKPEVPGTYVLGLDDARRGDGINRLCASLTVEANRREFLEDEEGYCDEFQLASEHKSAILERDWTKMLDLGASIFYTYKLAVVDGKSMQDLGGIFTGMSTEQFVAAMNSGGRRHG